MPENGNTANGNGQHGNGERVVIVSCDTHIGPRLKEDLRPYCPKKFLDDYDAFVEAWRRPASRDDAPLGTTGHYDVYQRLADLDQDGPRGGHLPRQPERAPDPVHHVGPGPRARPR
jgi:hypothetical protein